ncbi:o-succinylbenzoate synthase [Shewanella indica]|uniref:o-succinylbenzoate synthase n=2 Tax=Shewanellaceae TaxID=267890 RepID=A0ABU4QA50_9GAMM|nr:MULTISPECIES: o-succinylbenzoate synthase [Shewanella]MDX6015943.1 o-succinylbenzoate synthase [Shewanella indica]
MMHPDSLSLARYRLPLETSLPVGKQRIEQRSGLVIKASCGNEEHFVEVAPLSGLDANGEPLLGFSRESLAEVTEAALALMQALAAKELKLSQAADACQYPSLAWGLSLLDAKLKGQLPQRWPAVETIPLIYHREEEPLALLQQRLAALPDTVLRAKIKVAQTSMVQELRLIHAVLAAKPHLKLRLDANQGFEYQQAVDFCACLPKTSIEYIEEPCRRADDNPALFKATGIRYALDESLLQSEFVPDCNDFASGLTALVLKPMLLGSLTRLQTLIEQAEAAGVRALLSSSLESSLGIADLEAVSALLTPNEAPGLDTLAPFGRDIIVGQGHKPCLDFAELELLGQWPCL